MGDAAEHQLEQSAMPEDDDLLEGFDLPPGLDDLPSLPADPAAELAELLGEGDSELDSRMEVQRAWFDPDEPQFAKFAVTGDTYPIKNDLKKLGCRWNGAVWVAPDERTYKAACAIRNAHARKRFAKIQIRNPLAQAPLPVPPPIAQPVGGFGPSAQTAKPIRKRLPRPATFDEIDEAIAGMDEAMGARKTIVLDSVRPDENDLKRRRQQGQVKSHLKQASNEQLAEELRSRGFSVEKLSESELVLEAAKKENLDLADADAAFEETE